MYFKYVGDTHIARRDIARYLLHIDKVTSEAPRETTSVDNILTNIWAERTWWLDLRIADFALAIGVLCLASALAIMIAT